MDGTTIEGLSNADAQSRLRDDGANTVPDTAVNPVREALSKFWAPVPWLLEGAVVLQFVLHKYVEAAVIAGLLVFNAVLSFVQEGRAQSTLRALKSRLALSASVLRDGLWTTINVSDLVRDDIVKLSLGAVVPADVRLLDGEVSIDQSTLTGESLPVEAVTRKDGLEFLKLAEELDIQPEVDLYTLEQVNQALRNIRHDQFSLPAVIVP